jgi:hypothetical protein
MEIEAQKQVFRYMLHFMRLFRREFIICQSVCANFPEEVQAKMRELREAYRTSPQIEKIVEREFSGFDEFVQELDEAQRDQVLRKLLEKFEPDGEPN